MAIDEILKRDQNHVPVIGLVTDDSSQNIRMGRIDDTTKGLKVMIVGGVGAGSVTSVATGAGLTGGTITTAGTISLDSKLSPMDTLTGNSLKVLRVNAGETAVEYTTAGSGTVTSMSVTTANGISGSVANATTTPEITLALGNITPSSIGGTSFTGNNTYSGANAFAALPTSSATPMNGTDLVNKNYVDTFAQGLTVKASCDVATTANITLSGEQTIDGVLTSASRVLVKNQSTQKNNGIYTSGAGAWSRTSDYDTSAEVVSGTFTAILNGTTQANTLWVQTAVAPVINTDPLIFSQLSSGGTGTVTSVSVVSANGFSGSVAGSSTTPAITLATSVTGILQGNGTAISAIGSSGSGNVVLVTGATLVTPTLGVASATSINKVAITAPATSSTLTIADGKTLTVSNTITLSGTDATTITFPTTSQAVAGISATQTLTNKRITKRVVTTTQSATPTINTDNTDVSNITGLAQAITSFTTNLSGSPSPYDSLIICITDNGTARAITWGASFESSTVALPTTTVTSTLLTVGFLWNSATSKWRCVATA